MESFPHNAQSLCILKNPDEKTVYYVALQHVQIVKITEY